MKSKYPKYVNPETIEIRHKKQYYSIYLSGVMISSVFTSRMTCANFYYPINKNGPNSICPNQRVLEWNHLAENYNHRYSLRIVKRNRN